jgi:predicted acyl esterase
MPALLPDGVDMHHVRTRLRLLRRPNVIITAPPAGVEFDHDVAIPARDGTILRANVFRPPGAEPCPAILCAHPYGKDGLPKLKGSGRRARFSIPF